MVGADDAAPSPASRVYAATPAVDATKPGVVSASVGISERDDAAGVVAGEDSTGAPRRTPSNPAFNTAVTDTNVPTVLNKLQKWGDYASFGEPVAPSKFIPMKTPLSPTLLADPAAFENVLTLPAFLEAQLKLGRKVGLIIDLSNHDCLYHDGVPADVRRVHVRNVAKSVPDVAVVSEAVAVAADFWASNPDEHVAIHCAYGFNRTGFVLCCYLIEKCGLSADEALESFARSRAPGVKHERFKEALRARYPTPGCTPVEEATGGGEGGRHRRVSTMGGDEDTLDLDLGETVRVSVESDAKG